MSSCSSISVCIPRAMSFSRPRPTASSSAGEGKVRQARHSHSSARTAACSLPGAQPHFDHRVFSSNRLNSRALVTFFPKYVQVKRKSVHSIKSYYVPNVKPLSKITAVNGICPPSALKNTFKKVL